MKRGPVLLSLAVVSFIGLRWWSQYRIEKIAAQASDTAAQLEQLVALAITKVIAALAISTIFSSIALFMLFKRKDEKDQGWAFGILGVVVMFWLG